MQGLRGLAANLDGLAEGRDTFIVAVDGGGGAGKSTFADALSKVWPAAIVHTDDFASWDNAIDWWPRLRAEVLVPIREGREARFQKYDWNSRALGEWETVAPGRIILEGVSASRSEFRPCLDYCIWIETPHDLRLARGLQRDGEAMEPQWRDG
jgi:uridine kinase